MKCYFACSQEVEPTAARVGNKETSRAYSARTNTGPPGRPSRPRACYVVVLPRVGNRTARQETPLEAREQTGLDPKQAPRDQHEPRLPPAVATTVAAVGFLGPASVRQIGICPNPCLSQTHRMPSGTKSPFLPKKSTVLMSYTRPSGYAKDGEQIDVSVQPHHEMDRAHCVSKIKGPHRRNILMAVGRAG
jgi:hypothetical protein